MSNAVEYEAGSSSRVLTVATFGASVHADIVEIVIPNRDRTVRDGITAQIRLFASELRAHFLSPALMTLDEMGRLGVKAVDENDRVIFHPVRILADRTNGIWVDGLPDRLTLITVGQEFVRTGQRIEPVPETQESAS